MKLGIFSKVPVVSVFGSRKVDSDTEQARKSGGVEKQVGSRTRDKSSVSKRRSGSLTHARRRLSTAGETIGFESDGIVTSNADCMGAGMSDARIKGSVVNSIASVSHVGKVSDSQKVNQDRCWSLNTFNGDAEAQFCGVADGHGVHGHSVSELIRMKLPKLLGSQPELPYEPTTALMKAHAKMNQEIMQSWLDVSFSGSTCVSVFIKNCTVYCANVGDSRAIMGTVKDDETVWYAKPLSNDHKPDDPVEERRILSSGGRVSPWKDSRGEASGPARVWLKLKDLPGLAMSRSFGDKVAASVGVIADPTITTTCLCSEDKFIVVASDGVWEFLSNDEVVDIVRPYYIKADATGAVEAVCNEATLRWKQEETVIDDITAVVIFLKV